MAKRMLFMLLGMMALVGGIAFVKFRQIQAATSSASYQPPPEAVTTLVAKEEVWEQSVGSIGTVSAVQGVTVSADLPGIIAEIAFDSGHRVRAGEVLVKLDTRQEVAQLAAAEAQRDLDKLNLERIRGLLSQGIAAQADDDDAVAKAKQSEAHVGELQATIDRKIIKAPFAGVLGIRQVNLGQYLAGGDPVVPLQSLDPIYVDFGVPQEKLEALRSARHVRVESEGESAVHAEGSISAINSVVDPATRNAQVRATLANPQDRLQPGMFVRVQVILPATQTVIALPASSIRYAPYGNSVFIVEDMKSPKGDSYRGVRQQFVKLGEGRGDQIAILSGLKPGEEVVTSGAFKLRNGAAVLVNNEVQPGNNPAPKPEDS
jgi:membrane fusion protein (multidrug efflux system)